MPFRNLNGRMESLASAELLFARSALSPFNRSESLDVCARRLQLKNKVAQKNMNVIVFKILWPLKIWYDRSYLLKELLLEKYLKDVQIL